MVIPSPFLVETVYIGGPLLSGNMISGAETPQLWLPTVHTLWIPSPTLGFSLPQTQPENLFKN